MESDWVKEIRRLLARGDIKKAISLLQRFNKDFFVVISGEYRSMARDHTHGKISMEQFRQFHNQLAGRILSELEDISSPKEDVPQDPEDNNLLVRSKQGKEEEPMASEGANIDPIDDGPGSAGLLEELTILSLSLEFFDWSQRDFRENLGELLVSIEHHLKMLSNDALIFSERRVREQLYRVRDQNQKTKATLSNFRTANSEELLNRAKNIELPKLAIQLEALVDRLTKR